MDRFVDISVHKSQNGQNYSFKWLTVVASSEQLPRRMVVVDSMNRSIQKVTWPAEVFSVLHSATYTIILLNVHKFSHTQ